MHHPVHAPVMHVPALLSLFVAVPLSAQVASSMPP
jgi:hypothetical protein